MYALRAMGSWQDAVIGRETSVRASRQGRVPQGVVPISIQVNLIVRFAAPRNADRDASCGRTVPDFHAGVVGAAHGHLIGSGHLGGRLAIYFSGPHTAPQPAQSRRLALPGASLLLLIFYNQSGGRAIRMSPVC